MATRSLTFLPSGGGLCAPSSSPHFLCLSGLCDHFGHEVDVTLGPCPGPEWKDWFQAP